LPKKSTLQILKTYLPQTLFNKLNKYVTANPNMLNSTVDWTKFKLSLKNCDLKLCAEELLMLLEQNTLTEENVKIFHIHKNEKQLNSTEPTHKNTLKMITKFIISIYQRNVLSSLIKYILLKPLLQLFESSNLIPDQKGIFSSIYERLNEIVFESVLTAFNGSKYDNFLLCNYLIVMQCKYKNKLKIFKKGASLSTIQIICKKNLNSKLTKKILKKKDNSWPMNLFIKDIRDLVSSNMTLDQIGHLFSLNVSKLCFPYEQATSIKKLKNLTSLKINDELFWTDTFTGKTVCQNQRQQAQTIFTQKNFKNLYEFGIYYLTIDCLLLHSILLKIFHTYLQDSINIFIRRKYSQSSLSFQQFFIIEPSKQIDQILAPVKINNSFFNYLIKQAVTGGLCTSFVHGFINNSISINEHFNYISNPNLVSTTWPNFTNLQPWKKNFNEKPSGILTFDIRSLYPSAALKKIPVGIPLFYSRFVFEDFLHLKGKHTTHLKINSFCTAVQEKNNPKNDFFKLVSQPAKFIHEFNALKLYLDSLPKNMVIHRFQSNFTAMGQLFFGPYPLDGFLSYTYQNKLFIKLIQYQSVFYHGHTNNCSKPNINENVEKYEQTLKIKKNITHFYNHFLQLFSTHFECPIEIEYVELSECNFLDHIMPKKLSNQVFFKNDYNYESFLKNIFEKKLTGFLVVKNLEIKKNNQNPIFGFIIQKVEYDLKNLSEYTQKLIKNFSSTRKVISLHKSKSFMVISTEYLNWLNTTFGFENQPDIYHALIFQLQPYLRNSIESKLFQRKQIKEFIKKEKDLKKKQNYEIKAELIKLMLNSCYGFTMCNLGSSKFKSFENRIKKPRFKNNSKIISCVQLQPKVFIVEKKNTKDIFETLLGHVGCSILFHSKIILLKRLYFLLKFLNPTKAQLLYMDTDSAHFLVKHKQIENNVDDNLKLQFLSLFDKHFETGNKISGIWVEEGFFEHGEYFGEKCYRLFRANEHTYLTHIKGLNNFFQQKIQNENIVLKNTHNISYNAFIKTPDFLILKTHLNKNLYNFFVPVKRYFVCCNGSLPLKLS